MGFMSPKVPAPPKIEPAPTTESVDTNAITEDRSRRSNASGSSKNIISSLWSASPDSSFASRISKLLG